MSTRKALLMIGIGAIFTAVALGGAPMGLPMAQLGEGNWGIGGEYGHENMDLQSDGTHKAVYTAGGPTLQLRESVNVDDLVMNMFFATIAYGVGENWDVFVRLGVADAGADLTATEVAAVTPIAGDPDIAEEYDIGEYDGSFGFAGGAGTRVTFHRSGPWTVGGLAQFMWFKPGESDVSYTDPIFGASIVQAGEASVEFWETQVSLAAIYQADTLRVWAGPYLRYIRGDLDRSGDVITGSYTGHFSASDDLEEKSQLGGHVGLDWEATSQMNLWIEGQITGDSLFVGVGLTFHPEQTFGM